MTDAQIAKVFFGAILVVEYLTGAGFMAREWVRFSAQSRPHIPWSWGDTFLTIVIGLIWPVALMFLCFSALFAWLRGFNMPTIKPPFTATFDRYLEEGDD